MSDVKYSALLSLAKEAIRNGKYTVSEAEEFYKVKIPDDFYPSKETNFYIIGPKGEAPDYYGWATYFLQKNKFFSSDGGYFVYDSVRKCYRRISESEIDFMLTMDTNKYVKPIHRNNFIRTLAASSYKVTSSMKPPEGFLNVKNGVLDVKQQKLLPHDSSLFFTYCLPHDYDPKAKCDRWMQFLNEVFSGSPELKIIAAQIFGYILLGGNPWLHQAFVLYGEGRNGKSTFLDILKALVGADNFTTISLGRLDSPFSVVHLDGKIANIVEETPNDKINAEVFKTAIGGGHLLGARKFENEYQFQCNARFIFACNEMPKFSENSTGLLERLYFLPFNAYFEESKRDRNILNKLMVELPGVLNWALSGLSLLLEEKRIPVSDASKNTMEVYREESDTVYAWAKDNVSLDFNAKLPIRATEIYNFYRIDMIKYGHNPVSVHTFSKRLKKYIKALPGFAPDVIDAKYKSYKNLIVQTKV